MTETYKGRHELARFTQRMAQFIEQMPIDPVTKKPRFIKEGDFPYPYITKRLWRRMGEPQVIEITILPILPA